MSAVPGLESQHHFRGLVLCDNQGAYPRLKVRQIIGLHDRADADDVREAAAGDNREIVRPSYRRGKTIVYDGVVQARSQASLRELEQALRGKVATTREWPVQITDAGTGAFEFLAKPMQLTAGDVQGAPKAATFGYERAFVLGLRMSDARFRQVGDQLAVSGAVAPSGGIIPPFTPPILVTNLAAGSVANATNEGDAHADPLIDIYGPVLNPRIVHEQLGLQLRLLYDLQAGSFIRIDWSNRSIQLMGVEDYRTKLDRRESAWWRAGVPGLVGRDEWQGIDFAGINSIRLLGDNIADPARIEVRWQHTYH